MDDLYFRSLPSRPMEVVEYEQLSYYKRNKLTQAYYEDNPGVTKYYEDKEMIVRSNKDSLHWLKVYKKYIPESDVKSHKKLDEAIFFNFTKPEHPDFERCWALKNLRLLTAKENNIKRAKLAKPFQPALKIF